MQICSSGTNAVGERVNIHTRLPPRMGHARFKVYCAGRAYIHPSRDPTCNDAKPLSIDRPIMVRVDSNGMLVCEFQVGLVDGQSHEYLSVDSEDDTFERPSKTCELQGEAPPAEYLLGGDGLKLKMAMFDSHAYALQRKIEHIQAHLQANVPRKHQPEVHRKICEYSHYMDHAKFTPWLGRQHAVVLVTDAHATQVWHRWITDLHSRLRRNGAFYRAVCR
jgi:hypothetical protein